MSGPMPPIMTGPVRPGGAPGPAEPDPLDPALVVGLSGHPSLRAFNEAGILDSADVHTALRLGRLAGESGQQVLLAAALAVRAPRMGHVSVDLRQVRSSVVVIGAEELDLDSLPWPEPGSWLEAVAASPLVTVGPPAVAGAAGINGAPNPTASADTPAGLSGEPGESGARPLRLVGSSLYLDRYWRDQADVAQGLLDRAAGGPGDGDTTDGDTTDGDTGDGDRGDGDTGESERGDRSSLSRLFPGGEEGGQVEAVAAAMGRRLAVIVGGPGTGKTTTVARFLVALFEDAEEGGRRPPLVALAAPTGKAAARMEEAVRAEAARVAAGGSVAQSLASVSGSTIHRLLGSRPDRVSRFRHHAGHRLPHDVVIVDEASMVSLSLMARLVEAVRPDARLVLVGDPEQLVSVEAGAVLADIAGPVLAAAPASRPDAPDAPDSPPDAPVTSAQVTAALVSSPAPGQAATGRTLQGCVVALRHNHRFAGALADLAAAVRSGDADNAVAILRSREPGVEWIEAEPESVLDDDLGFDGDRVAEWRRATIGWAQALVEHARAGDTRRAAAQLASHRILCAHRRGEAGVAAWNSRVEQWLAAAIPDILSEGPWYAGRPILVTANDYSLRLFNGDTGVAVAGRSAGESSPTGGPVVAFEGPGGQVRTVSPYRLSGAETVFAMTVHKSQGSEFDRVSVLLPPASSRLLTRELLYTACTRARTAAIVIGPEAALRAAVTRPIERASGLGPMLWAPGDLGRT